jgi:hypothetical protein
MRKAQWILLTALGLTAGVFSALVLGGPVEAVVGMILVTPVLTGMVGLVLGASQWLHMRRVLSGLGGWWVASTCLGLGLGLAAGVVLVEQVGRAWTGESVRLLQLAMLPRALSFAVLGAVSGWFLGMSQWIVLRRREPSLRSWPWTCALALAAGFPASSLLVDLVVGGLKSPAGLLIFLLGSGAVLGASTAQRLRGAA